MKKFSKKVLTFAAAAAAMIIGSAAQVKAEAVPLFDTAREAQEYVQEQLQDGAAKVTVNVRENYNIADFSNVVLGSAKYDAQGKIVRIAAEERDQWLNNEVSQLFGAITYKKAIQRDGETVYEAVYGEKASAKSSAANYRKLITDLPSVAKLIGAASAKSDEEKAKAIFDYVRKHVTYGGVGHAGDAYVDGQAICGGYTDLFYILAQEVGLDVRMMHMNGHAWNIVKIAGKWYEVDSTWASSVSWDKGYDYFLAGTDDLTDDTHTYTNDYKASLQNSSCPTAKIGYGKKSSASDKTTETKKTETKKTETTKTETETKKTETTKTETETKKTETETKKTEIKTAAKINLCKVSLEKASYFNDGTQRTPAVKVKTADGKVLKQNVDFKVQYAAGRKAPGKYNVTVSGIGSYSGSVVRSFTINKKIKLDAPSIKTLKKSGKTAKVSIKASSKTKFQIRYRKAGSKNWKMKTVNKTSFNIKGLSQGKYQFSVRATNKINGKTYTSKWSKTKTA